MRLIKTLLIRISIITFSTIKSSFEFKALLDREPYASENKPYSQKSIQRNSKFDWDYVII